MKKLFSLLLCLSLLLCCGCGAKDTSPAQEVPEPAPAQTDETEPAAPEQTDETEAAEPEQTGETAEPGPAEEAAEEPDDWSPDFRFSTTDRDGNPWDESIFAQYELTMINFWEPWCGPCVGEMPDLQALYDAYADRGLLILGVYATPDMEEDVDMVLQRTGAQYSILHHCADFEQFESGYVPTTVFVDRDGHVLHRELDQFTREVYSDVIGALGEERASALFVGSMSYDEWAAIVEGLL